MGASLLFHWVQPRALRNRISILGLVLACASVAGAASSNPDSVSSIDSLPLGWKRTASGTLNLSQVYYDNWIQGGSDALAWQVHFDGDALLRRDRYDWESRLKADYGQTWLQDLGTRPGPDELTVETIYTYKWSYWINPFASSRLQTQWGPGYIYDDTLGARARVSGSFDPTYWTQTVGLGKSWRKDAYKARVGGTLKETFSKARYGYADDPATTGVIETEKTEPGASFTVEVRQGLMENILLASVIDLFANFKALNQTDVRWENQITAKVNKYVSANADFDLLYDRDVSVDRQIREGLSIGISFLSL